MNSQEYADLVDDLARQYVCENKSVQKLVAKAVMAHTPTAVLANSMLEPTEDQLLEVVELYNPYAAENLGDELRPRYTAICKLYHDVNNSVARYREERLVPVSFRILESISGRYLTWIEADPNCDDVVNDEMAEFKSLDDATQAVKNYANVMNSVQAPASAQITGFNRYHERI